MFLLVGDLGAGKTAFTRGFIQSFAGLNKEEVPSPTFTLVQTYDTEKGTIWHFDLYRLKDAEEVWELGFEDALSSGISLIEWPERIAGIKLKKAKIIHFKVAGENQREISYDF